jgi:hypothetical protein
MKTRQLLVTANVALGSPIVSFKEHLSYPHEAEWNPFQTHCYTENLVELGIELGTSAALARNSDH